MVRQVGHAISESAQARCYSPKPCARRAKAALRQRQHRFGIAKGASGGAYIGNPDLLRHRFGKADWSRSCTTHDKASFQKAYDHNRDMGS